MDPEDYVEGLSGEEIIIDVLVQTEKMLRGDCNLRNMDAYDGGYDGWIEVHLNLRGLDTAVVKRKIVVGAPASVTLSGAGEQPIGFEENTVNVRVDIPLEPHLNLVRERSGQGVPTVTKDENGQVVVKKRHYARKSDATGEV